MHRVNPIHFSVEEVEQRECSIWKTQIAYENRRLQTPVGWPHHHGHDGLYLVHASVQAGSHGITLEPVGMEAGEMPLAREEVEASRLRETHERQAEVRQGIAASESEVIAFRKSVGV